MRHRPTWNERRDHHKMRLAQVCGGAPVNVASVVRTAYLGGLRVSEMAAILSLPESEVKEMIADISAPVGGRERRHLAENGMILDSHYPPKGERVA